MRTLRNWYAMIAIGILATVAGCATDENKPKLSFAEDKFGVTLGPLAVGGDLFVPKDQAECDAKGFGEDKNMFAPKFNTVVYKGKKTNACVPAAKLGIPGVGCNVSQDGTWDCSPIKSCIADSDCNDGSSDTMDKCMATVDGSICNNPGSTCSTGSIDKGRCIGTGTQVCDSAGCTCNAISAFKSGELTEVCNGLDDDCDGATDEGFGLGDACDSDDSDKCANGKKVCDPQNPAGPAICPASSESKANIADTCNSKDDDCDGLTDEDFPDLGKACDTADADKCTNGKLSCKSDGTGLECPTETALNIAEICNDSDDNCDGATDENCDKDKDGFCNALIPTVKKPAACPMGGGDCDDTTDKVNPSKIDLCNGLDDNCSGKTDEDFPDLGKACTDKNKKGECKTTGYLACFTDGSQTCIHKSVDPSAEVCEGSKDEDCDGETDEGCDPDKDGFCDKAMTTVGTAACKEGGGDCAPTDGNIHPKAVEICDDKDNNCNGQADEGCDDDGDEYCDAAMKVVGIPTTCTLTAKDKADDCADDKNGINPGAKEVCDKVDQNCNGQADEGPGGKGTVCSATDVPIGTLSCNSSTLLDTAKLVGLQNNVTYWEAIINGSFKPLKFDGPEAVFPLTGCKPGQEVVIVAVVPKDSLSPANKMALFATKGVPTPDKVNGGNVANMVSAWAPALNQPGGKLLKYGYLSLKFTVPASGELYLTLDTFAIYPSAKMFLEISAQ